MATLTVNGRKVTVDDSFKSLSREQQEATVEEIASSMNAASKSVQSPASPSMFLAPLGDAGGMGGAEMMAAQPPAKEMSYGEQMAKAAGAMGRLADGFVRGAANGLSFGSADRLAAVMGSKTYEEGLKEQRALTAAAPLSGVGNVVGMVAGGVGLAKNGVTLAGRLGEKLLPRVLGYGAEGAAYGAATEAGNNDGSAAEKLTAAKQGALIGGSIGGALPVAGGLVGKGYELFKAMTSKPVAGTRSANALMKLSTSADDLAKFDALGPNAMLSDASPTMLGLAQGAASKPGTAKDDIVKALMARDEGTVGRLQGAREAALGPRVIPSQVEADLAAGRAALGPEYDSALRGASAVDTSALASKLEQIGINSRGPGQSAAKDVRGMLDIPGNPGHLDPYPRALLSTRQAIDGMRKSTLDGNVKRILGDSRAAVDAELAAKVPGIKTVDAKFAELSNQSKALERGQEVFDTARGKFIRPEEFASELRAGAAPSGMMIGPSAAPARLRQGMNAEVDRVFATGSDDLRAIEGLLRKPANAEKMQIGFGEAKANPLLEAITQNRKYRDTLNAVDRGSQTAQRTTANAQIEGAELALPESGGIGGLGIKAANKVLAAISGRSSDATRQSIADMMKLSGNDARKVLVEILSDKSAAKETGDAIRGLVTAPGGLNSRVGAFLPQDDRERRQRQSAR